MVHNNAIMDKDGVFEVDGFRIEFKKGKGLEGDLNLALILIEIMIEIYHQWVQKIFN